MRGDQERLPVQCVPQQQLPGWPIPQRPVLGDHERLLVLDLRHVLDRQVQERWVLRLLQHGVHDLLQHQLRYRKVPQRRVLGDQQRLLVLDLRHVRDRQVQEWRVHRHVRHGVYDLLQH